MYISHKAIDRPRVVMVGVLIVIAMAILAGSYIPVQRTPAINTAVVLVMVPYPGSQPVEAEDDITRKIEDALLQNGFTRQAPVDTLFDLALE